MQTLLEFVINQKVKSSIIKDYVDLVKRLGESNIIYAGKTSGGIRLDDEESYSVLQITGGNFHCCYYGYKYGANDIPSQKEMEECIKTCIEKISKKTKKIRIIVFFKNAIQTDFGNVENVNNAALKSNCIEYKKNPNFNDEMEYWFNAKTAQTDIINFLNNLKTLV